MQRVNSRYPWRFGLYFIMYYLSSSVYQSFIGVYFTSRGVTTAQLSVLMAAIPMISIFAQPAWGALGDRMQSKRLLLILLSLGAMGFMMAMRLNDSFWYLLVMITLFSAMYTAIQPLGDSIVLESLMEGRRPFGPLRLIGCLTFAVSSRFVGGFLEGRINYVIYLTSAALILLAGAGLALPKAPGRQRERGGGGFFSLLKDVNLRNLLIFVTLLQITMGYFYTFFSVHFTSLEGGTSVMLGWCYLASALCEVPFLLMSDKLFDRFGAGKLLTVAAAVLTLRWLILGSTSNVYAILASQALHGGGFIVMTLSMSKYISFTVPEELRARGQMLLAVVGFGVARVIGSLGGGFVAGALGMQRAFYVPCAIAAVALIVFGPRYMKLGPLNGK